MCASLSLSPNVVAIMFGVAFFWRSALLS